MPRSWDKAFQAERRGNTEILGPAEQAWRVQGTERTTASVAGVECQRWEATEGGREPYTSGQEVGNRSKWEVLGGERPNRAEVIFKSSLWFL